jgi:hypothetical protein
MFETDAYYLFATSSLLLGNSHFPTKIVCKAITPANPTNVNCHPLADAQTRPTPNTEAATKQLSRIGLVV